MTLKTTCPLVWDPDLGDFRPITDVLPDLAEWGESHPDGRTASTPNRD